MIWFTGLKINNVTDIAVSKAEPFPPVLLDDNSAQGNSVMSSDPDVCNAINAHCCQQLEALEI
jgi:hypothetical protein